MQRKWCANALGLLLAVLLFVAVYVVLRFIQFIPWWLFSTLAVAYWFCCGFVGANHLFKHSVGPQSIIAPFVGATLFAGWFGLLLEYRETKKEAEED